MMLRRWVQILPLFVVRWMALRWCERLPMEREGNTRWVVCPLDGVYFRTAAPAPEDTP
jgi:hypothetical protein